jgi:hypothetical protein
MAKDALLLLRMEPLVKSQLEAAALARGQSVAAFALEVLRRVAAERQPSRDPAAHFALLVSAAHAGKPGGFGVVGQWLARNVVELQPTTTKTKVWWAMVADLKSTAVRGEAEQVMEWLQVNLPGIAVTIPAKRMAQVVTGMLKGFEQTDATP